jgi:hypothetical protein
MNPQNVDFFVKKQRIYDDGRHSSIDELIYAQHLTDKRFS